MRGALRHQAAAGRSFRRRAGSVLVLVAGATTLLFAASACVVDLAVASQARAGLQAALDAGVLAGAHELLPPVTKAREAAARQVAVDYVKRNGHTITPADVTTWQRPDGTPALTIRAREPVTTLLAGVIGIRSVDVAAVTSATLGGIPDVPREVLPLGLPAYQQGGAWYGLADAGCQDVYERLTTDPAMGGPTRVQLKVGGSGHGGNNLILAIEGRGANPFRQAVTNGVSRELSVGDVVETEPGNKVGPTEQALAARLARGPQYAWAVVPLIGRGDWETGHGRNTATIIGFASVRLIVDRAKGEYVGEIASRVMAAPGRLNTVTPGLYSPVLIATPAR